MTAVQLDDAGGHLLQEGAVMGDKHHAVGKAEQEGFQPLDAGEVQMVGGLIEQQHVGLAGQGLAEQGAALLAAGQLVEGLVRVEFEHRAQAVDLVGGVATLAKAGLDDIGHDAGPVGGHILGQPGDAGVGHAHDLALVGLEQAGEHAHEGGLALAVASEQADALAAFDLQRDVLQQGTTGEGVGEVLNADECHGARGVPQRGRGGKWKRGWEFTDGYGRTGGCI